MAIGSNSSTTAVVEDQEINRHSDTQTRKQLAPESYQYFLSDAAKKRKRSPSESNNTLVMELRSMSIL